MYINKVGISTNIFNSPENTVDIVGLLALNFKIIEIEVEFKLREKFFYHARAFREDLKQILDIKEEYSLDLSLHAPYIGMQTDIANKDKKIRQDAIKCFKDMIDATKLLQSDKLTIHPGYVDAEIEAQATWEYLLQSLQELSNYATDSGVMLLLENTGDYRPNYIVLTDEQHLQLCHSFKNIYLTLDLVHFNSFYQDSSLQYWDSIKKLLPYIKNVHFADMQNNFHSHLPLGYGNFDFDRSLKFMYDQGYEGNFITEEIVPDFPSFEFVNAILKYIKSR